MSFLHRSVMLLLIKLVFVRFGNFLLIAMMDFRTAYIIRKPFAWIFFFWYYCRNSHFQFRVINPERKTKIMSLLLWNNMLTCSSGFHFYSNIMSKWFSPISKQIPGRLRNLIPSKVVRHHLKKGFCWVQLCGEHILSSFSESGGCRFGLMPLKCLFWWSFWRLK